MTSPVATTNATSAAFSSKRMKKPNQLTTLDLENAIDSGKTLIGQLGESSDKKIQQGEAMCRDDRNKDYWTYQVFMSKDSN